MSALRLFASIVFAAAAVVAFCVAASTMSLLAIGATVGFALLAWHVGDWK